MIEKFRCEDCLTVFKDVYDAEVKPCTVCDGEAVSYANSSMDDWGILIEHAERIAKLRKELNYEQSKLREKLTEYNNIWSTDITEKDL